MIDDIVSRYIKLFPAEVGQLAELIDQIQTEQILNDRKNFEGHITGSAFVLSPDRTELLVVYHTLFNKWLQPGGHWDVGDAGPWAAAKREASKETTVSIDKMVALIDDDPRVPFGIKTHTIQDRPHKKEPGHNHHDFKYVFTAKNKLIHKPATEVNISEARWVNLNDPLLSILSEADMLYKLKQYKVVS